MFGGVLLILPGPVEPDPALAGFSHPGVIFVALLSAFINNPPVVAICVPPVCSRAQRVGVSPSKLLMPLGYASILGGQLALVGSASNLIVTGLGVETLRAEGLPAFSSGLQFRGSPAACIGIAYRSFDFPKAGAPLTLIPAVLRALICPAAISFRSER